MIKTRVEKLLGLMKERDIDAYIVYSADAHQSEYVTEHDKARAFMTGFTGSAGTLVVTKERQGLWTDGRYFIQADKQIEGSGIELFKMAQPGVPTVEEFLAKALKKDAKVGFDGATINVNQFKTLKDKLSAKNVKFLINEDLVDLVWNQRPELPKDIVKIHQLEYAGESVNDKLKRLREKLDGKDFIVSNIDDIAWILNLRGSDVNSNPVFISYLYVGVEDATLFINQQKVTEEVAQYLKSANVNIKPYTDVFEYLENKSGTSISFDTSKTSAKVLTALSKNNTPVELANPITKMKSIKSDFEAAELRKCHVSDSVALVRFMKDIKENVGKESFTEYDVDLKLQKYRSERPLYQGPSFDTIAGYMENAAMMHYKAQEKTAKIVNNEGLLLVDSGGQYLNGTTDITRTFAMGPLSADMKKDFTLVLKGMMQLSRAVFLEGTKGIQLDILARQFLWENHIDYKCGTGHGVGYYLCVHEGPQGISTRSNTVSIEPGMILTNEPGVYKDGEYGIRIENTLLCEKSAETKSGQFLKFETISYFPIDIDAIDAALLTDDERQWLNDYHKKTYEKLSPFLSNDDKEFLAKYTREI